jgi:hypothetical protein
MGNDEKALKPLWHQKRGEAEWPNLSGVLIAQLGLVTEDLNRLWYKRKRGRSGHSGQTHVIHRTILRMAATLGARAKCPHRRVNDDPENTQYMIDAI